MRNFPESKKFRHLVILSPIPAEGDPIAVIVPIPPGAGHELLNSWQLERYLAQNMVVFLPAERKSDLAPLLNREAELAKRSYKAEVIR